MNDKEKEELQNLRKLKDSWVVESEYWETTLYVPAGLFSTGYHQKIKRTCMVNKFTGEKKLV